MSIQIPGIAWLTTVMQGMAMNDMPLSGPAPPPPPPPPPSFRISSSTDTRISSTGNPRISHS